MLVKSSDVTEAIVVACRRSREDLAGFTGGRFAGRIDLYDSILALFFLRISSAAVHSRAITPSDTSRDQPGCRDIDDIGKGNEIAEGTQTVRCACA
jgi:hypothetical protein